MQLFGLVSLIVVIALAAWWLTSMGPVAAPTTDSATTTPATSSAPAQPSYGEVLEGARGAAGAMGD